MDLQFYADLKKSLVLDLETIIDPDHNTKELEELKKKVLAAFPTNIWNVNIPGNMEVQMEVEFKKFLFSISDQTNQNPIELSVFDFYALLDSLKERRKKDGRSDNKI
ncbi:MAG TPA: hypothetical protein VFM82_12240 [Flavobacteriaceae bacterium]|nr:hypothetical protein [Flavobacteriaceae bacterium]